MFGSAPVPTPPPPNPASQKQPPPPPATSTAEQQRSYSLPGTDWSNFNPSSVLPRSFSNSWHPGKPIPPPSKQAKKKTTDQGGGEAQNAASSLEQQVSHVLGGTPQGVLDNRHRCSKSLMKIAFDGMPSDMDTPRLHRSLSALPYDAGVTCDIRKINVKYDALSGRGAGTGSAQFRNVPDRDKLIAALHKGQEKGWLKAGSFRVVYDDTKKGVLEA